MDGGEKVMKYKRKRERERNEGVKLRRIKIRLE